MILNGEAINYTSKEIIEEMNNVLNLSRIAVHDSDSMLLVALFIGSSVIVEPIIRVDAVKDDPSDNKFIECAIASNASFLISNDNHLLSLKHFERTRILSAREFLRVMRHS